MSAQTSTEESPAPPARPDRASGAFRVLGLVAVCIGVVALAAATFVLSYAGIHAVVLQAGIQPRYARGFPLLIDAMLVIVLAALLYLRGAGLPSRTLAWLTLLVVLAAAAGADALHATGRTLTHDAAAITGAVLPWALVLLAFLLLLTMLRHARQRHQAVVRSRTALHAALPRPPASDQQATLLPRVGQPSGAPDLSRLDVSQAGVSQAGVSQADVSPAEVTRTDVIPAEVARAEVSPAEATRADVSPAEASQPQISDAEPVPPLPVRTPQHWNSASIMPGFSRHLAASAAAGAAAAEAEESGAAFETDEWAGEPTGDEEGFEPDSSTAWAEDSDVTAGAYYAAEAAPADSNAAEADNTALAAETAPADDTTPADHATPAEADRAEPVTDDATVAPDAADPEAPDAAVGEDQPNAGGNPDQTDADPGADTEDDDMPVFHRMWSPPTPPES